MRPYTTLWNSNVWKKTAWDMYSVNDTSQCSVAMWFRCGKNLLYHKFTAESVLKEFLKSLNIWQSYRGTVLLKDE